MRTFISEANKHILQRMYEEGMHSKGKEHKGKHTEAAGRTGLDVEVVKVWVGNHHRKVCGRSYSYPKATYTIGLTAYNWFVHENKDNMANIDDLLKQWSLLPQADKELYKSMAVERNGLATDPVRTRRKLLKQLFSLISELATLGVDLAVIGWDAQSEHQIFAGDGEVGQYLQNSPVFNELTSQYAAGFQSEDVQKINLRDLRKKAQVHMNNLYATAVGKSLPFPYKEVQEGGLIVTGLPDCLLPMRPVSSYGEKKLNLILNIK